LANDYEHATVLTVMHTPHIPGRPAPSPAARPMAQGHFWK